MRILITGASGFVGSNLATAFLSQNYTVIGIDRRKSPTSNPRYTHIEADLCNLRLKLPSDIDCVIHCAAAKGDWKISEEEFERDNIQATASLISILKLTNCRRLIHFSTVAIYTRCAIKGDETTQIAPKSAYGKTKLEAEKLVRLYAEQSETPTFILRPSVIYGRGSKTNMYNLARQIDRRIAFTIKNDNTIKSHISISNVTHITAKLLSHAPEHTGVITYNLTERPYYNLNEIIKIIEEHSDQKRLTIRVPRWIAWLTFAAAERVGLLFNKDLGLTLDRLEKLTTSTDYTSERLWQELGPQRFSTVDELKDMLSWMRDLRQ